MKPDDRTYVDLGTTFSKAPVGGAPVNGTQLEILSMLFSPEEARVAAALDFAPEPEEIVAERAGVAPEDAADLLTSMASRGLIRGVRQPDGVRVFRQLLFIPGLFEAAYIIPNPAVDMEKLGHLFSKYFHEGWGREIHDHPVPFSRVLPHIGPPKEKVLPHEDAVKLVESVPAVGLVECSCRLAMRTCDCPVEICLTIGAGLSGDGMEGMPVRDSKYTVGKPRARAVSVDEAVQTLKRAEEANLVHTTMNFTATSWFICSCCQHACCLLRGITDLDIPHAVAPSRFWSVIEESECDGCGACEPVCPVLAIEVTDHVAEVDYERCLGCGVCIRSCPAEAMRLEERGEEIYTPFLDYNELVTALGKTQAVHTH